MLELLKTHFGYDCFRSGQEEIVNSVLSGKDSVVLMPTGAGKSLCFQLPALKFSGITIVISPLIALMKDQVDALQANGVRAEFINSSLDYSEIIRVQDDARSGKVKLLYVAPERLGNTNFQIFLQELDISLIAIDEAHCISEWGHDFRPDYRRLKVLRQNFYGVPLIALTATATKKVQQDIIEQLSLKKAEVYISNFNRPNLHYHIRSKQHSYDKLVTLLEKYKGQPTIIYCLSRKDTEKLAKALNKEGHTAVAYHAGLPDKKRKKVQEDFIHDKASIITATIAFGMGIDKPDIRLVVHYSIPKSIEGYYQETGRAGRDGLESHCVLFYSYGDKIKNDFFIRQIEDENEKISAINKLNQVIDFCEGQTCRRKYLLEYFGQKHNEENCGSCDLCLAPKEEFDATIIAQKILSAVIRTGQSFGSSHIIKVLRGSSSKQITQRGHNKLSVYGIVDDYSEYEMQQLVRQLIAKELLVKSEGQYPTLSVASKGRKFLQERQSINLLIPKKDNRDTQKVTKREKLSYDESLFEKLRSLRLELARERGVPPFIIFSDVALIEMAHYFPQSLDSFSYITGVGKEKLAQFGDIFIRLIVAYAKENNLEEKQNGRSSTKHGRKIKNLESTFDITKQLLLKKIPLEQIIQQRGLVESTIIGHIEKFLQNDEDIDISYLKPKGKRFEKIKKAFAKANTISLAPVRKILGPDYSYDEIRKARLFLSM